MDYGARISKPGVDVKTASALDLMMSSNYSTLKILTTATTTITTDGSGNGSKDITHGLSYAPTHFVWLKGTAQNTFFDANSYTNAFVPITKCGSSWIPVADKMDAYTDSGHLHIVITGAAANTTYTFKYFIYVDLARDYSGADGLTLANGFGLKVSKTGYDVKTAKEYQMAYSQKYKSLQYHDVSYKSGSITIPAFWSSYFSKPVLGGGYIDFTHGLGYPPFFLAYMDNISFAYNLFIPAICSVASASYPGEFRADVFCDATRIRVSILETSEHNGDRNAKGCEFAQNTFTAKCLPFTEDLTL